MAQALYFVRPSLTERIFNRLFSIAIGFGYVFYLPHALVPFMIVLFALGVGGANFAMYTLWLPEQYPTECRASAFARNACSH